MESTSADDPVGEPKADEVIASLREQFSEWEPGDLGSDIEDAFKKAVTEVALIYVRDLLAGAELEFCPMSTKVIVWLGSNDPPVELVSVGLETMIRHGCRYLTEEVGYDDEEVQTYLRATREAVERALSSLNR